jgi:hypothetical protein
VPFFNLAAADSANAWQAALPAALTWLWQQLAPPDLRVLFPVRTRALSGGGSLPVRPVQAHHHGPCGAAARPGHAVRPCGSASPGWTGRKAGQAVGRT